MFSPGPASAWLTSLFLLWQLKMLSEGVDPEFLDRDPDSPAPPPSADDPEPQPAAADSSEEEDDEFSD